MKSRKSPSPLSPPLEGGEFLAPGGRGQGEGDSSKKNVRHPLTGVARKLRQNATEAEKQLWYRLKAKQLGGYKFRRQHPIGRYVVDFVCFEKKLVIELDGGQHAKMKEKDEKRDAWLESEGFMVLRFWNHEALRNTDAVLEVIARELKKSPSPLSPPLKGGEMRNNPSHRREEKWR